MRLCQELLNFHFLLIDGEIDVEHRHTHLSRLLRCLNVKHGGRQRERKDENAAKQTKANN